MSREQLLELSVKDSPVSVRRASTTASDLDSPKGNPDAAHLELLQPIPDESTDDSESITSNLQGITDDVNALSLSVKRSTSYLGISSVSAVLRVIIWLDPEAQALFGRARSSSDTPHKVATSPARTEVFLSQMQASGPSSLWEEIPLIRAFFDYVHPFAPVLDEDDFKKTYMTQTRTDARWMLLLNAVLALGSIANATSHEDHRHLMYWQRANEHLGIETLGSAHIETVQALVLIGGLYLHHLQEPNRASSLMGAALRLATAIGLHRDFSETMDPNGKSRVSHSINVRRRVWWSAFILDAWAGYCLGRPSMGRITHATTVTIPVSVSPLGALFQENVQFCTISTRMEDSLAYSPVMLDEARQALDASFIDWYQRSSVQDSTPRPDTIVPHGVLVLKNVMRWRYNLCRILIHRPILLRCAMQRVPMEAVVPDQREAIEICVNVSNTLINDISNTWQVQRPCQTSGWNATWLLHQALMVPLLLLYSKLLTEELEQTCCELVETGISAFNAMRTWSPTASRSHDVVSRIYYTSRRHSSGVLREEPQCNVQERLDLSQDSWVNLNNATQQGSYDDLTLMNPNDVSMESMYDSLNWTTAWNDLFQSHTSYEQQGELDASAFPQDGFYQ
ncbi:Lactose regulatory protein LAC9 [Cyphellophora attinorum]|uniref:Lactose regulatory protein LAC9 n=1 Tax=Cyphellophora attinorum TaxID=1664694 RepID=A0A0N1H549_9EURO|nr:Lactose regulatory protein LAC9 [Phialophora attinorum]KPI40670.1 Lactose regulatory protein LAC9 [Phialophora attinorum]